MSDDVKFEKMMQNYQDSMEKARVVVLHAVVGKWAVDCLRKNTPMGVSALKEWADSAHLTSGEIQVIDELLQSINSV